MYRPTERRDRDADLNDSHVAKTTATGGRLLSMRPAGAATIEIGVLVDATGSSAAFSSGVPLAARLILSEVERQVGGISAFVQTHGDEDYGEYPSVVCQQADAHEASHAVATITYLGGGDAKETHLSAFEAAFRWFTKQRGDCRRVMIAFVNADTKPARSQRTPEEIGLEARRLGLLIYLICEPTCSLNAFAEAARGMVVPISNNPSEELMLSIARRIAGSVTHSVSVRSLTPIEASDSHGAGLLPSREG